MRYEIFDNEVVTNTVEADIDFMLAHYPGGNFREAPIAETTRQQSTKMFRSRFTSEERAAIEWAAVDKSDESVESRKGSAFLRSFHRQLDDVETISDKEIDSYVAELVRKAAITQVRAAEILK